MSVFLPAFPPRYFSASLLVKMAPLEDADREQVLSLLSQIRKLVVPQCLHVGDEVAFIARRDDLLDRACSLIKGETPIEPASPRPETISVNQQELAATMIQNTFDQHKNLLRKRLREAEEEALKWKQTALAKEATTASIQVSHKQTQTVDEDTLNGCKTSIAALLEAKYECFLCWIEFYDRYWQLKEEMLIDAVYQIVQQFSLSSSKTSSDNSPPKKSGSHPREPPLELYAQTANNSVRPKRQSGPRKRSGPKSVRANEVQESENTKLANPVHFPSNSSLRSVETQKARLRSHEPTWVTSAASTQAADGKVLYTISALHLGTREVDTKHTSVQRPSDASQQPLPALKQAWKKE